MVSVELPFRVQIPLEATTEALFLARLGERLEAIFTTKTKMS